MRVTPWHASEVKQGSVLLPNITALTRRGVSVQAGKKSVTFRELKCQFSESSSLTNSSIGIPGRAQPSAKTALSTVNRLTPIERLTRGG